jgi:hypothetical protein
MQLRSTDGTSPEQQPQRQAEHHRLDARLEQRHPARDPEQRAQDATAQAQRTQGGRHRNERRRPRQGGHFEIVGVDRADHGQRDEIVHDEHREEEGAQALRRARRRDREETEPQGSVARHRDPPAGGGGPAEIEGEVDRDGRRHSADGSEQRQHEPPSLAQLSQVELAARLEPHDEEEEGHQAAVDPFARRQANARVANGHGHGRLPDLLVRAADVRPDQARERGRDEDCRAARLRTDEPAQRRETARPHGALGEPAGRHRHWSRMRRCADH